MDTVCFGAAELRERRRRFTRAMEERFPGWGTAFFIDAVNQYYFTGTMQDGILLVINDAACPGGSRLLYGVRRSFARAELESPLFTAENAALHETLIPITSYRDLVEKTGDPGRVYIEGDTMPVSVLERLKKYFPVPFAAPAFLDAVIRTVRSVKSPGEIELIKQSGAAHRVLLEERAPALLYEGISEAVFMGRLSAEMYRMGYQGLARFHQMQTDIAIGQIGFGTNALYPARFDGPGGSKGAGPFSPHGADHERLLKKGDAVFVDLSFGIGGYHTDKTQVYFFGAEPPLEFKKAHQFCVDAANRLAERLRPGEIPAVIYRDMMASLSGAEAENFMGVDNRHRVKFLGHGTGLNIDEFPVIAEGFGAPLEENMTIALEPKKGVAGVGLAGVEDTYIVTPGGGLCVTGGARDIIRV